MDSFGRRLYWARKQAGLNQYELSDLLATNGVSMGQSYISTLEADKVKPRRETIDILARVLGVAPSYLSGVEDDIDVTITPPVSAEIIELAQTLQKFSVYLQGVVERANTKQLA